MEEIGRIIQSFIARPSIAKKIKVARVFSVWEKIVGKEIAEKSKPCDVKRGVLTVECGSSIWANELSIMSKKIISEINKTTGDGSIKKIVFRVK